MPLWILCGSPVGPLWVHYGSTVGLLCVLCGSSVGQLKPQQNTLNVITARHCDTSHFTHVVLYTHEDHDPLPSYAHSCHATLSHLVSKPVGASQGVTADKSIDIIVLLYCGTICTAHTSHPQVTHLPHERNAALGFQTGVHQFETYKDGDKAETQVSTIAMIRKANKMDGKLLQWLCSSELEWKVASKQNGHCCMTLA